MCRKSFANNWLSIVAVLAALTAVSTFSQTVQAAKHKAPNPTAEQALRTAYGLLAIADRDYQGHRAKAAAEVHHALRELGFRHEHKVVEGKVIAEKDMHEAQQRSDAQLRQAQQILQGIQIVGNHPKAANHVQAAIGEIGTALTIK